MIYNKRQLLFYFYTILFRKKLWRKLSKRYKDFFNYLTISYWKAFEFAILRWNPRMHIINYDEFIDPKVKQLETNTITVDSLCAIIITVTNNDTVCTMVLYCHVCFRYDLFSNTGLVNVLILYNHILKLPDTMITCKQKRFHQKVVVF